MRDICNYKKVLLLVILLASSIFWYGCGGDNPVPERTVMRNLRREFPNGNFEIYGMTYRRVPAFPYFHFDFRRNAYDVYVIRCLDYDITFTTLDGSGRASYLRSLLSNHMADWNNQLTDVLSDTMLDMRANIDDSHARISFLTSLSERSVWNSSANISYVRGSHVWLRDIASFEEGFAALSNYDSVGGVFFDISYNITLNSVDIDEELEYIKTLAREFVLPIHNLVTIEDRRTVTRLRVDFLKLDSNNPDQDVRLGRFEWVHDSMIDDALENIARFDLSGYFEIASVYDESSLLETVCFEGHELIGVWGRNGQPMRQYHFNEDGTGYATYDSGREFVWRIVDDDYLLIAFGDDMVWTQAHSHTRINEIRITMSDSRVMPLVIDGNTLEMQVPRRYPRVDVESYMRVEWPLHLRGSWTWEGDSSWVTTMNSDGTGSRGFPDDILNFRWVAESDTRQIWKFREGYGSLGRESWSYELDGDILALTNWYTEAGQRRGQTFRYLLVEYSASEEG